MSRRYLLVLVPLVAWTLYITAGWTASGALCAGRPASNLVPAVLVALTVGALWGIWRAEVFEGVPGFVARVATLMAGLFTAGIIVAAVMTVSLPC